MAAKRPPRQQSETRWVPAGHYETSWEPVGHLKVNSAQPGNLESEQATSCEMGNEAKQADQPTIVF